jgi:DNA polymerase III sliding clamp (beta) subunit (PCNA family)
VTKSGVTLRGESLDIGQTTGSVKGVLEGVVATTYANGRYLLDAINAFTDDEVEISFAGPTQPIAIRPVGRADFVALVMPVTMPKVASRAA